MIEGRDYFVRLVDFPTCACGGAITPNDDGTYSIYINSRLSEAQKKTAMAHELSHAVNGDFYRPEPVEDIETFG